MLRTAGVGSGDLKHHGSLDSSALYRLLTNTKASQAPKYQSPGTNTPKEIPQTGVGSGDLMHHGSLNGCLTIPSKKVHTNYQKYVYCRG